MRILAEDPHYRNITHLLFASTLGIPRYYVPVSDETVKQIRKHDRRITAFHVCSIANLEFLKTIQNSTKSISTSIHPKLEEVVSGVLPGNAGILVKVTGNVLIDSPSDIWSRADSSGTRWVDLGRLIDIAKGTGSGKTLQEISVLKRDIAKLRSDLLHNITADGTLNTLVKPLQSIPWRVGRQDQLVYTLTNPDASIAARWIALGEMLGQYNNTLTNRIALSYLKGLRSVLRHRHKVVHDAIIDLRHSLGVELHLNHDEIVMDRFKVERILVVGAKTIQDYKSTGLDQKFNSVFLPSPASLGGQRIFRRFIMP